MYCRYCGNILPDASNFCSRCGNSQHTNNVKKRSLSWTVIGIILLIIGSLTFLISFVDAFFNSIPAKTPQKVSAETVVVETSSPQKTAFSVGDVVELDGVQVTLCSVTESTAISYFTPEPGHVFLICEFNIENNSSSDIAISSLMCFEAYADDYAVNMDLSATVMSNKTQLDGTIAAGKKMNGVIGYQVPENWSDFEIRFTPSFWSRQDIIFVYNRFE